MPKRLVLALAVLIMMGLATAARGSDGDPLVLGTDNYATSTTLLHQGTLSIAEGSVGLRASGAVAGVVASADPTVETAVGLDVEGPVHFRRSGRITIPAGEVSVTFGQEPLFANKTSVLAVLQTPHRRLWVASAEIIEATQQIRIYLNRAVPQDVVVAYMVLD